MLDGRVKTLHPKIHGGLLYVRGNPVHEAAARKHDIKPIDLVVVNLYPFAQTVARPDATLADAIENIDIGGPSMLRSAAKNHQSVTVRHGPGGLRRRWPRQILAAGNTTPELRRALAAKVFAHTAAYDGQIAAYLAANLRRPGPRPARRLRRRASPGRPVLQLTLNRALGIALRRKPAPARRPLRPFFRSLPPTARQGTFLQQYPRLDSRRGAWRRSSPARPPTLAIVKHTNPCGAAQGATLREAWEKAFATDRQAPFGGIIAANRTLDLPCAEAVAEIFSEVIVAPDFAPDALELLQKKTQPAVAPGPQVARRRAQSWNCAASGPIRSWLRNRMPEDLRRSNCASSPNGQPTEAELQAMLFGWKIVKHVKSNAIVFAAADRTLGIGAGQMSRVDASRIAIWKAQEAGLSLAGSAVCSDAFFPFPTA